MSKRKFRKTEISKTVVISSNGQHMKCNWFCINCYAVGSIKTHYPDCIKPESYAIPSTAQVPKKYSSKRKWNIFLNQFVFSKPEGWWFYSDKSWYYSNNKK